MDQPTEPERMRPRLVLVTPVIENAAPLTADLEVLCANEDVAAVVARLRDHGEAEDAGASDEEMIARIRMLAPVVQGSGVALMIDGLVHLVAPSAADGVQVSGSTAVQFARRELRETRMIGARDLASRHDAMSSGEFGADYVMFGEPGALGRNPAMPALVERVRWWAELFNIPCIAYAASLDEIPVLTDAGADFIALGEEVIWNGRERPADALAAALRRLDVIETV